MSQPGMHKYQVPSDRDMYILYSGAYNFVVAPRFLETFCTSGLSKDYGFQQI